MNISNHSPAEAQGRQESQGAQAPHLPSIPGRVLFPQASVDSNPSGMPQLQDVISRLVETCSPQAIGLFGSQARSATSLPVTILSEGVLIYAA